MAEAYVKEMLENAVEYDGCMISMNDELLVVRGKRKTVQKLRKKARKLIDTLKDKNIACNLVHKFFSGIKLGVYIAAQNAEFFDMEIRLDRDYRKVFYFSIDNWSGKEKLLPSNVTWKMSLSLIHKDLEKDCNSPKEYDDEEYQKFYDEYNKLYLITQCKIIDLFHDFSIKYEWTAQAKFICDYLSNIDLQDVIDDNIH